MRYYLLLLLLTGNTCMAAGERTFTGSTPAGATIRPFLGIASADSVDFIRWDLQLGESDFKLSCNYGVGKPNTKLFIGGGKRNAFSGSLKKEGNYWRLSHDGLTLTLLELNENLLLLSDNNKHLLVGTGGWSYTLSNAVPQPTKLKILSRHSPNLPDSMGFHGRTPCTGVKEPANPEACTILKWSITLYADPVSNKPASYRLRGTSYRVEGERRNNWTIETREGKTIYTLLPGKGQIPLYLLRVDDNNVMFADAAGNPFVGNKDFSYTLSRKLK